jgi:hypothetical protein
MCVSRMLLESVCAQCNLMVSYKQQKFDMMAPPSIIMRTGRIDFKSTTITSVDKRLQFLHANRERKAEVYMETIISS